MIEITLEDNFDPVKNHIVACAVDSNALHLLFNGFATVFTYDETLRQSIDVFWPLALEVALDAVGDGAELRKEHYWFDFMVAALLPTPNAKPGDQDIDGTFACCREHWIQPEAIIELAERWLHLARWEPKAVDAVVQFSRSAPTQWQASVAFEWIERIIDDRFDLYANKLSFLEEWLTYLKDSGIIVEKAKNHYHRIVDGLAAAGDRGAVRLQQFDE